MRMLNLPNCEFDNLACDIGSEIYSKFQQKAYGLRDCNYTCRVGDLEERILTSYLYYSGYNIDTLLDHVNKRNHDHGVLKTNEQLLKSKHH